MPMENITLGYRLGVEKPKIDLVKHYIDVLFEAQRNVNGNSNLRVCEIEMRGISNYLKFVVELTDFPNGLRQKVWQFIEEVKNKAELVPSTVDSDTDRDLTESILVGIGYSIDNLLFGYGRRIRSLREITVSS